MTFEERLSMTKKFDLKKRRMRILSARIFSKFFGGKIRKLLTAVTMCKSKLRKICAK